jgi:hypothetical protein
LDVMSYRRVPRFWWKSVASICRVQRLKWEDCNAETHCLKNLKPHFPIQFIITYRTEKSLLHKPQNTAFKSHVTRQQSSAVSCRCSAVITVLPAAWTV